MADDAKTQLVQSVARAAELLERIAAERDGARLKDLAAQMNLKPPTVHNLVRTLVHQGLVRKRNGHYVLGPTLLHLGERYRDQVLAQSGTDGMLELASRFPGATVTFVEIVDGVALVTHRISGSRPAYIERPAAFRLHAYGSASGIAAQAFGGTLVRESICGRNPFHEYGAHLWGNLAALETYLEECRARGYATLPFADRELFAVAVPVYCRTGAFVGLMGGSLPLAVAQTGSGEALTTALLELTRRLAAK